MLITPSIAEGPLVLRFDRDDVAQPPDEFMRLGRGARASRTVLHGVMFLMVSLVVAAIIAFLFTNDKSQVPAGQDLPRFLRPSAGMGRVSPAPEAFLVEAVAPADAAAINDRVPVIDAPIAPARPFVLPAGESRDRASGCLTAAVYYEAASETIGGQAAVAQVVLNRMRHPAYPNTVCGVVFQGSERTTGCQFTFTCDGAITQTPSQDGWALARRIAETALSGYVYAPVGWATHYHTRFVIPKWRTSLEKIAVLGAHIFYRWQGNWGLGDAFRQRYGGAEPTQAALKQLSTAHAGGAPVLDFVDVTGGDDSVLTPGSPAVDALVQADLALAPGLGDQAIEATARARCGAAPSCRIRVWFQSALVPASPATRLTEQQAEALAYTYTREARTGNARSLFGCRNDARRPTLSCLPSRVKADQNLALLVADEKQEGLAADRVKSELIETPQRFGPSSAR